MHWLERLNKPQYVFRPSQVVRRLVSLLRRREDADRLVQLPWGLEILANEGDLIGSSLIRTGVYDLPVSEALWRLLEPGETAVDVGANIGYMAGLLAARAGPDGAVIAFEPHPLLFSELAERVLHWKDRGVPLAPIDCRCQAVSDVARTATLQMPSEFKTNRGTASLVIGGDACDTADMVEVAAVRLATVLDDIGPIGVMKVDVEGHEQQVFAGGEALLSHHRIRDIVFEEHNGYPSPVTETLENHGYTLFQLGLRLLGPRLTPAGEANGSTSGWDAPSLLATVGSPGTELEFAL